MDKLLTTKEVAEMLSCHPQTLYKNKEFPRIVLPGIGVRFKEKELNKYLEQKTVKSSPLLTPLLPPNTLNVTKLDEFDKLYLKKIKGGSSGSMKGKKIRWNYGFGSIYIKKTKQGKDRWYVDYHAGGKRIREVVKNAQNRAQAVMHLQEKVTEAFNQVHCSHKERKPITFTELGDVYLQNYAKVNKKSWKEDMYRIEANLKPFFGGMNLDEITPLLIENYRAERLKTRVTKSTVNRETTIMKRMFNLAIDWNLTDENPVAKVRLFSEKDTMKERILTEEEEVRLLAASSDYLKSILIVALNTGMRRGEILNLRWSQVDLNKRFIKAENTKSGKNRIIPINDYLHPKLMKLNELNGKSEYVFPNPKTGRPFTEVKKSFKNACRKVGIDDLRFHDLRHSFASRLVESGADLITVRDLLGHFSVRVTQRYVHSNQKQKKEAVQLLVKRAQKKPKDPDNLAHICHTSSKDELSKSVSGSLLIN